MFTIEFVEPCSSDTSSVPVIDASSPATTTKSLVLPAVVTVPSMFTAPTKYC